MTDYEWLNLTEQEFTKPDKNIYEKNVIYPSHVFENLGFQYFSGAKISSIVFNPIRYNPVTGTIKYIKKVEITLIFEDDIDTSVKPARLSERSFQLIKNRIKNQVENPSDVDLYFQVNKINRELNKTENFNSTEIPSLVGNNIDYVVITNETLKTKFEEISDWKTKKGLPSVVRTVEWIYDHYSGSDGAERIRNFIIDANTKWGTIWFLLGGDANIVPLRYAWHSPFNHWQLLDLIPNGEFIPTDMYYACLDGNWNADGDATFGEGSYNRNNDGTFSFVGNSAQIDNVDLGPDVNIGRIPVQSETELNQYITKYFEYIKNSAGNENNILLFSANSDYISSSEMNDVYDEFPTYTNRSRLYENYGDIKEDVLDALNAISPNPNYHIICGYGHGDPYNFEACVGNINRSELDNLQNNDRSEIMYLNHCSTMAWDKDCVGEHFLESENGGVAFIGNTRFGWTGDPSKYNDDFIDALYNRGDYLINDAFYFSKTLNIGDAYRDRYDRWGFFALNISADPEMPVWTNTPQTLLVNHPTSIQNGENSFTVTINNLPSGQEAVVCLKKDLEDYAFQTVTGTGSPISANFTFTPDTPGNLDVTITAHNFIPYEAPPIPVNISTGAHLFIADNSIDDDDAGSSSGNSDGQIDAGETIELTITLENSGSQNAANVTAILSCDPTYITITQNQSSYGDIIVQSQAVCQNKYIFQVNADTPDDESIEFTLNIQDNVPNNYEDKFYIQVGAPELDHIKNIVIANSQIMPYQSVDLNLEFLNSGDAQATGISATLSSSAFYVFIVNATASYPDIDAYTSSQSSDPFRFMVDYGYSGQPIPFTVNVTNEYGKSWIYNFEIDDPSGVGFGTIDFSGYLNEIDLWWDPVSGIRGYNIYRSDTETGAYEKINDFIVEGTSYFKDTGLVERSDYFYKISAVDVSGNESDLTAPFKAWTTLPYYADWPVTPSNSGNFFGPVKLANIDSESDLEIIAGNTNERLYAWKHNGNELFDIDNNPTTVSGFYNLESSIWGAPAISDINNDGIDEIIVTTRDVGTNRASVFAFQNVDDGSGKPEMIWTVPYKMLNGASPRASIRGAVLADLENDGYMEIIVQTEPGDIFILDHQGNDKAGYWPIIGDQGQYGTPLVIDINGDGYKEIIAGFKISNNIKIWDYQGNEISDFSCDGWVVSSLIAANLDNDSEFEILYMTTSDAGSNWGHVYAINPDGSFVPGWSTAKVINLNSHNWHPTRPPSLVVGDLDDDGIEEIICGGYERFYIWDKSGTLILDRPVPGLNVWDAQPILADLDEDDDLEILISSKNNSLYAFDIDGGMLLGWPVRTSDEISSTAVVGDINNDGKNEVVCGSNDGILHIWQTEGSPKFNEITTFRYNNLNNGIYIPKKSGQISSNQIWSGIIDIIGDLTITSGTTLTINPGTELHFDPGVNLTVNGTLNVQGTANDPTIFTSINQNPSTSDWYGIKVYGAASINHAIVEYANRGIYFYSGATGTVSNSTFKDNTYGIYSYNSDILVDDCTFQDASVYAIYCSYGSPTIKNNEIFDCKIGIKVSQVTGSEIRSNEVYNTYFEGISVLYASPDITDNYIHDTGYSGIYLRGSNSRLEHNSVINCSKGIYGTNNSNFLMHDDAYNKIVMNSSNSNAAIKIVSGTPILGEYHDKGKNDIRRGTGYAVQSLVGAEILAEKNYWGSSSPSSSWFYGDVAWSPYLSSPPSGAGSSLEKGANTPEDRLMLEEGLAMLLKKEHKNAATLFKGLVSKYPESRFAGMALALSMGAHKDIGGLENQRDYLQKMKNHKNTKVTDKAHLWHESLESLSGNKAVAEGIVNSVSIDSPIGIEIRLNWADNLINVFGDMPKAELVFGSIINSGASESILKVINDLKRDSTSSRYNQGFDHLSKTGEEEIVPEEFYLSNAYPNPFNPETKIRFNLPEDSHVKLEIYNIQGQRVITLFDKMLPAGIHIATFNGSYFSSGIYFYRLEAGKFNQVKRMLLIR